MFIYKITNKVNNKLYIGLTTHTIDKRFKEHIFAARSFKKLGRGKNSALYSAINKYGEINFKIEQIDTATDLNELKQKERYWIKTLNTIAHNGYNLIHGGERQELHIETKRKIGLANSGRKPNEAQKAALTLGHKRKQRKLFRKDLISGEIKAYSSLYEAGLEGFNRKYISRAITSRAGKSQGYFWYYEGKTPRAPICLGKKVIQFDLEFQPVAEFSSINITRKSGFNVSSVWRQCVGLSKSPYKNYYFRFREVT